MPKRITCILSALALTGALWAHEGAEHVTGSVKSITPESLTVETVKHETLTIMLTPKTEVMKSKAKGDIKDLKVGDRVVVHAAKGKAGQLEAQEVDFGAAPAAAPVKH
jgi:hypothetical protein